MAVTRDRVCSVELILFTSSLWRVTKCAHLRAQTLKPALSPLGISLHDKAGERPALAGKRCSLAGSGASTRAAAQPGGTSRSRLWVTVAGWAAALPWHPGVRKLPPHVPCREGPPAGSACACHLWEGAPQGQAAPGLTRPRAVTGRLSRRRGHDHGAAALPHPPPVPSPGLDHVLQTESLSCLITQHFWDIHSIATFKKMAEFLCFGHSHEFSPVLLCGFSKLGLDI